MEPKRLSQELENYQRQQRDRVQPQLAMLESSEARLTQLEGQKERLIAAYTSGVIDLSELATQKALLDKEVGELGQAVSALRAEAEPQLLSARQIEDIKTIAVDVQAGADMAHAKPALQRRIFQLLNVSVTLGRENGHGFADVTCNLGGQRCSVESETMYGHGLANA